MAGDKRFEGGFVKDSVMPLNLQTSSISLTPKFGDMFSKEHSLPHLPVPELNQTMENYLKSLEPITSVTDLERTAQLVQEFCEPGGMGESLQAKLVEKASKSDNWLAEWWDKCAYYGNRDSVVINSNPAAAFPQQTFFGEVDQFRFTAKLIHSVLKFKSLVENHLIPVDYARKEPLAMVQYTKLLSMCRVPLTNCDKSIAANPDESRHVIVAHNNTFFSMKVYKDGTGAPLSEEELMQQLAFIVHASEEASKCPVGILTSERRNKWAQTYQRLMRDSRNKNNLVNIEKSICLICLDNPVVIPEITSCGYEDLKMSVLMNQILHGGGSAQNSANRWFDKPMQFIVNRNGFNGMNCEHSGLDGTPMVTLINQVMENSDFEHDHTNVVHIVNNKLPPPKELKWNLNYDVLDSIELAMEKIDQKISSLELRLFKFDDFGKNVPKNFRISPDAFFQVCLQLAYWRLHFHHPPTYESASIRRFSRGRTECIRSGTPEVSIFVREMDGIKYDDNGKKDLFMKAIRAHVVTALAAADMKGVDKHLFGLRMIAIENGIPIPEIFKDKAYRYAVHFQLSTSQVSIKYGMSSGICFGPVVPDGYGCAYNIMENQFLCSISAFHSHPNTQAGDLGRALGKALKDVHSLLTSTSSKL